LTKNKLFGQEFNSKLECFAYSSFNISLRVICNKRLDITEEVDTLVSQNSANIITKIHSAGLKRIPASVCGLRQLQRLDMKNNSLEILDRECFRDLSKLLFVLMAENRLTEIPDNIFDNCSSLQMVDFSHNKIRSIGMHVFSNVSNLKNLKLINLSGNMLTTLEPWPLIRMINNRALIDLSKNRINIFTNELNWIYKCDMGASAGALDLRHNTYSRLSGIQDGWGIDLSDMLCILKTIVHERKAYICDCKEYWWLRLYDSMFIESCITIDQTKCHASSFLGWLIQPTSTSLALDTLNCTHSCFDDQCTCTEIPDRKEYHVKCYNHSQVPTELPKPYHWNPSYQFTLDFPNQHMTVFVMNNFFYHLRSTDQQPK
jgi:hypothetical protein